MLFNSITFLFVFLPVFLGIYFLLPGRVKKLYILIGGFIFLAWASISFLLVVLFSILINYQLGLMMHQQKEKSGKRPYFIIAIVVNLGMLLIFKYSGFLASNFNSFSSLFGMKALKMPDFFLPLGISFYTFRILSYHIELFKGKIEVQKSLTSMALYISFFPQLSAGPIVRYRDFFIPAVKANARLSIISNGLQRFLFGLIKKVLLANSFGLVADAVFKLSPAELTLTTAWLGVIAYTLQIYYDFSGYSDMAIGLAAILGFRTPENFNYPYMARSVRDFWRRWHMTLTSWFRDYLFLPLALSFSRRMPAQSYFGIKSEKLIYIFGISITWFLVGLWHGASWTFIVWGLIYGAFLVMEQLGLEKKMRKLWRPLRHIYTILIVMLAWIFFRAATFQEAFGVVKGMLGINGINSGEFEYYRYVTPGFVISGIVGIAGASGLLNFLRMKIWKMIIGTKGKRNKQLKQIYRAVLAISLLILFYFAVAELLRGGYNPFIYIRF